MFLVVTGGMAWGQTVTLISPTTTGLTWSGAENVEWSTSTAGWAPGDTVLLELSSDGGVAYDTTIARNLPYGLKSFRFHTTPLTNGSSYRIKITKTGDPGVTDESDYNFTISNSVTGTAYYVNDASTTNDVYCTAVGNDLNDGLSPATPRLTLQTVINDYLLGPGDVVYIDTGEWVQVGTEASITAADKGSALAPLSFTGSPNGTTFSGNFMPGSNRIIYINRSSYLTFSDLTLESTLAEGIYIFYSDNITVSKSTIRYTNRGVEAFQSNNVSLLDNLFQNNNQGAILTDLGLNHRISGNTALANAIEASYTILINRAAHSLIQDNSVHNNFGSGIAVILGNNNSIINNQVRDNNGDNLVLTNSPDLQVTRNQLLSPTNYNIKVNQNSRLVVFNNFLYGQGIYFGHQERDLTIVNNIIWAYQAGTYCLRASSATPEEQRIVSDCNLLFPTGGARIGYWKSVQADLRSWILASGQDGRSRSENPLFVDFSGGDYHLQSTEGSYHNGSWTTDPSDSPGLNAGRVANATSTLTVPVSVGSVTLQLASTAGFLPGPERVQVEEDIITYSSISGNTLTGCSGVRQAHPAGAGVFQPIGSAYDRETGPNGKRVNIGLYANTDQASRSSRKSILVTNPQGNPEGAEKWSREKGIEWRTIGNGWAPGDTLTLDFSGNSIAWNTLTEGIAYDSSPYPSWNTESVADSATGRIRITPDSGEPAEFSGTFIVDNTPPEVGLVSPPNGAAGQSRNTALIAEVALDPIAGLNAATPYYFRIDTAATFDTPNLKTSGWLAGRVWYIGLQGGTEYYWQVRARDDADPPNVSDFFAETGTPNSYWRFRTALILHAEDIESTTTGLRWMLDNYDLEPGDTIYVEPGSYTVTAPLEFTATDEGDENAGVRIEGFNGEVILDGAGTATNCLQISGDWFEIANFSCTNAVGSGVLITGDHNRLQGGSSHLNGGDGVEIRGDYNIVQNILAYGNLRAGLRLVSAYQNQLVNNTATGNGTREISLEDSGLFNGSIKTRLTNNILSASGTERTALYVENASRTGLESDHNLLYTTSGAKIGYWGGTDLATFSQWTETSFQDQSSLSANPLFVGGGNYHLQSTAGSYKPGIGWTADGRNSPGIDRGDPLSIAYLEPAPNGGRVNLGCYGNTLQASHSPLGGGRNFYVNDAETDYDYFCATGGLPWPIHDGTTPGTPLDSIIAIFDHHILQPGDNIYVDTGLYNLTGPVIPPLSGTNTRPLTFVGSPRGSILDGQGLSPSCFQLEFKDYISIGGFILANPAENALYARNSHYLRFSRNRAVGAFLDGLYLYQAYGSVLLKNQVENNLGAGLWAFRSLQGLTARENHFSNNFGTAVQINLGEDIEISENTIELSGESGLRLNQTNRVNISGNIFRNNGPFADGSEAGISLGAVSDGFITDNSISASRYGIDNRSKGTLVTGNRIFSNYYGLYLYSSTDCQVENNIIYDNKNWGLYSYGGNDVRINNNTLYDNGLYEVYLYRNTTKTEIYNNIISPQGIGNYGIYIELGTYTLESREHRFDYNTLFPSGGATFGYSQGAHNTLWNWQTASRQDGHSLTADPLLANPVGGKFHLSSTEGRFEEGKWYFDGVNSPGLNRGTPDMDFSRELAPDGGRINIGAYSNTAEASRSSIASLTLSSPIGTAVGMEKWSQKHNLSWKNIGDGWSMGDLFDLEYSINGSSFTLLANGIPWPGDTYPNWDTSSLPDGKTYQVRIRQTAGGTASAVSGLFIIDNSPPVNVGCFLPPDRASREPVSTVLLAREATDNPAGLAESAYYFQLDTVGDFTSPELQNSDWREYRTWTPDLLPNTWYYWRVRARDEADPPNESAFFGETDGPDGYRIFKTVGIYHALDIESPTDGLRWILENTDLTPGDIVYVDSGNYALDSPLKFLPADSGDKEDSIQIIGVGGEVLLDGSGFDNCLEITGDYFHLENFSFSNAGQSGLLVSGDHNTIQGGRSFNNGKDGIEVTGDWSIIKNMLVFGNGEAGIRLFTAHHCTLESNTCSGNGTFEVRVEDEPVNPRHPERPVGSTHTSILNSILDTNGAGRFALSLDEISQTGFASDYNLFQATGGASIGYWDSTTRSSFSDWTGASGKDFNSISGDPLFAGPGDYHLQSTRGSYHGGSWSADPDNSPGLDRGNPDSPAFYEPAPNGGRINLGAYGNTVEASWSSSTHGTNYYVNDLSTEWDYYCSTAGLPWPEHSGLSPNQPLNAIQGVIDNYSLNPGDTIYVDTGSYYLSAPIKLPKNGLAGSPITIAGSPQGTIIDAQVTASSCLELTNQSYISLANLTLLNVQNYGFYASGAHYLRLAGITTRGASLDGFYIFRTDQARIIDCASSDQGRHGFYFSMTASTQGLEMLNCLAERNGGSGILLNAGTGNSISGSTFRSNASHGLQIATAHGTTSVTDNTASNNQQRGFFLSGHPTSTRFIIDANLAQNNECGFYVTAPTGSRVTGNRTSENIQEGFYFIGSAKAEILGNLSFLNGGSGYRLDRCPGSFLLNNIGYKNAGEANLVFNIANTDITIRNNIFWAAGAGNHAIQMAVANPADYSWRANYNCLLADEGAYIGYLGGPPRDFATLFNWQVASGQDGASINYDPVFVDADGEDFHIQSPLGSYHNGYWNPDLNASPCLNQGQVYLAVSTLANNIFPASPYIDLVDATDFSAATDLIEINGNIISYTGKIGNRLTGVAGITAIQTAGSGAFQPIGSDYTREPFPHGERIDIGAYGGMEEASISLRKTLPIIQPLGREKWSGTHNLRWLAIPTDEWSTGEPIAIAYSTDGFDTAFSVDTSYYPTQNYAWDTLLAAGDSASYQVRVDGGGLTTTSGVFAIDNTPPVSVGCLFPEEGDAGLPTYIPIRGREPSDALVGLNTNPYYFQIDISPVFSGPGLQSSGWLSRNAWRPNLETGTTYYWRVKARDAADLPNESGFCGFTADTDGYGTFSTSNIFRATDIESTTTGLRWILANEEINPGDTIILETGTHFVNSPLIISEGGSPYSPLLITGSGIRPILDGGGGIETCLILEADYVNLENISFTAATGTGLQITGANNVVREGASYLHGGSGVEITGPANQLLRFLAYNNGGPGVRVSGEEGNRLANLTAHNNQTAEVSFENAPYSSLADSILWATGPGIYCVYIDAASETGFASDYNNLYRTGSTLLGYWSGDRTDLSAWQAASLQDAASISLDPLFFNAGGGDYHLKSRGGRWNGWLSWTTTDTEDSPSIDVGNPASPYYRESSPKGGRINQGAFGNTIQASRTYNSPGTNFYLNDLSLLDNVFTTGPGNDSNNGRSPAAPKLTLDGMGGLLSIDLGAGDSVFIDTGEYHLSGPALIYDLHSGAPGNPVSFVGSPHISLVDGNFIPKAGVLIETAEHIVLDRIRSAGTLGDPNVVGSGYGIRGNVARSITIRASDISWHGQALGEGGGGVRFTNSTDITLKDNRISFTTGAGISLERGGRHQVSGNLVLNNTGSGITSNRAMASDFTGNTLYNNRGAGISLIRAEDGTVGENTVYSNRRTGIDAEGDNLEIRRNLVYDNNVGSGINISNAGIRATGEGIAVVNNTLYKNRGNELRADSAGLAFRNNIAWAHGAVAHAAWFNSIRDQTADFNLLTATGGGAIGHWSNETAYSFNEWQLLSGLDSHSLGSDPGFVDPAGTDGILGRNGGEDDDFHLSSTERSYHFGSWTNDPFDSMGLNVGNPYDPYDRETAPNGGRVNLGAYGDTPEASRSSQDTIYLTSPDGGSAGAEKWSRSHDLTWEAFGPGWGPGRTVQLEYTADGATFFSIASGVAWDAQTYSTWNTSTLADGRFYQVRLSDSSDPSILSISGRFIVDNTPPTNIGSFTPVNNQIGVDPENTSFLARTATDALSGLNDLPYYFRVDTVNTFNSPDLVTSGWVESQGWNTQSLIPDRWYYWQVAARDASDLPNVSAFGADQNAAGTTWVFKTARVYHVTEVEGANELRDVLTNKIIEQGDIIRLRASGDFEVAGTGVISPNTLTGTATLPIRIEGYNGRPLVYGDGLVDFLLDVQSYYTRVQGIDFTGSGDVGLRISGDDNIVNRCQSFEQGGAGVEITGDHNLVKNTMSYLNGSEGIFLDGGSGNRVLNNSLYGNETAGIRLKNATPGDLRNNISWAVGEGSFAIAVDFASQTELLSDGNDLYTTEGARIGLWDNQTQVTMNNWRTVSGQDVDSINANPKFYQIALWGNREYIYDLHLRSPAIDGPSPCYNAGINLSGVVDDDYDGENRPFGAAYDIGADEWVNTNSNNNLPDYWELQYFGDLDPDRRDNDDPDGDSLNNIREYRYYTDPTNSDTDGDGLLDGYEVDIYHTNPLDPDTDWDGLEDGDEIGQGTNPTKPDTDGDGLLDGQSINATTISAERIAYFESHNIVRVGDWFMGELSVGTNPLDPDTDKDGCPDGWEVFYGLNPLDNGSSNINDGGIGDPDGDRLNNYEEYLFGTSPIDGSDPVTRYVDAASAGGNGSSWPTAWNSIRNALDWKADTDIPAIVLVTGGVYYESNLELDEDHSGLALLGAHPYQRPVIDGGFSGRAFSVFNVQTAKIDSFEIRHARFSGPGGAFYLFGSSPILSNLVIHNNTASGIGRGGAIFVTGANARPLIIDNTIAKNTGYSNFGGIYVASGFPRYANNIIWHNGIDLYQFGLTTETIRYCNLGSQEGGLNIIGFAGNISRAPNFRHLGANRFHLATFFGQANPNINAGTSAEFLTGGYGPAMLADYEGEGRWNYLSQPVTGGGITGLKYYDIGADEYVDTDYNTLPDWWETKYWGAIGQNPTLDPDADGLTNYEDYYYLTNPRKYDTAVSGMSDGEEVAYWNTTHGIDWPDSPAGPQRWDSDVDGDGTINILDADSDGDKLIDGFSLQRSVLAPEDAALLESLGIVEVAGWFMGDRTVGTDPANPDTDGDWLEDGDEVYYWVYEHNLLFPDSASSSWDTDWDGDGVPNILDWDSDGDLVPDGWEVFYGLDPNDDGYYFLEHGAGGDPDGDRLNNYIEYLFDTNPRDGDDPDYVVVDINGTIGIDCDYNYIKDAIAGEEGPIRIIVRSGVYPESEITPKNRMALLGEYAATTIIEPPEGRAVIFSGVDAALLDGFTIRNAEYAGPGAGILCYAASPFISNSIISFNTSSGTGGYGAALYAMESSYPILVNNTIASNRGTDGIGGVALESSEDNIFLINNILWDNQTDLFGTQTEMVHYCNLESGLYDGVNFNLSEDPLFTNPLIGNYRLYYTSPMICAGGYPLAGGFDMDGTARPQVNCPGPVIPGPPVIKPVQESFNIGAHEAAALPSPSPSVTPTPSPSITPTPSVTPSPTPTAAPPSIPPTPEKTPFFPSPTPWVPTPPPTATPLEPPAPPTPATTPDFPTRTPTPVPTATPEFTPSPTHPDYKTPTPSPTPIDFYYRDPAQNSWLNLYVDSYDTYYSIGWTGDDWRDITGMPPLRWYAARWTYGSYPGQSQWSEWTYHETETQYLEPSWPSPSPTPEGFKTPTPVPDFYYRDTARNSHLYLYIDDYDTYYSIGWAGDNWQAILDMPDYRWYAAQWTYGPPSNQKTQWSEWTYHGTEIQYLEPDWPPRTPTVTPTATVTPPPTRPPTPAVSPTPSVTPSPSTTPTPSYAYWYSAAGATEIEGIPFDTFFAVNNPTTADAYVEFRAVDEQGLILRKNDIISPESRYTLHLNDMVKGTRGENNPSVSVLIYDLTDRIILVDRSMYWDAGGLTRGGGHNSVLSHTAATRWALPEGATHIFDEYIHVVNPNKNRWANVKATFMNEKTDHWEVENWLKPESNWTIHVNDIVGKQPHISTLVESLNNVAVAADRTMYFTKPGYSGTEVKWVGGHSSRGTSEKSTKWFIPEGAIHMFDHWVLITNPDRDNEAVIRITLMDLDGVIKVIDDVIPPLTRYTCYVNRELNWSKNAHVSTIVESLPRPKPGGGTLPAIYIMCERAMYWKPFGTEWGAAHATIGALYGAPVWYLPEGATIGFDEFILLANPDPVRTAEAKITFYFEDKPPQDIYVTIGPQSRQTVYVNLLLHSPAISARIEETTEPFSAKIPIIAERSMYWHCRNPWVQWVAGHATIGIPVRVPGK